MMNGYFEGQKKRSKLSRKVLIDLTLLESRNQLEKNDVIQLEGAKDQIIKIDNDQNPHTEQLKAFSYSYDSNN